MNILNLAAYRFVALDDLPALRERVLGRAAALALRGTVLLAPEGINLFLAGPREAVDMFMAWLREDPRFAGLEAKESPSDDVPFGRLRVRLKKEIITMHVPAIRPEGGRAPAVDAATLKRWLDQGHDDDGRDVLMLDTRNGYETALGKFAQAVDYRLASFTAFPAAVAADRSRFADKTVVSYCTGGIRCEKAALHMQELGIEHVHQLEGGILKYLELTDGAHWQGNCFVFDGRGAVGPDLLPASEPPFPAGAREEAPWMTSAFGSKEKVEVKGRSCEEPAPERALSNAPAGPASSPHSSPQREKEANARSALLNWSRA
jgi:UPF0176 protein